MTKQNKSKSGFLIPFWSIVNVAYLSMSNIDLKSSSKAPIRVPPKYSKRLLLSSLFINIDVITAYYYGLNDFFIWDLLCVITSINYWRDSRFDWRRTIDMIVSMPLFLYHIIAAIIEINHYPIVKTIYLCIAAICAFLFWVGFLQNDRRFAQITHSMMHIIGSLAAAWIYTYLSDEREQIQKLNSP